MSCSMIRNECGLGNSKCAMQQETKYERLRRQKIEANTRKLELLGLLALAATVKPAIDLKR